MAVWTASTVSGALGARAALTAFSTHKALQTQAAPDQHLWSPERVSAYAVAGNQAAPTPLAVLRIARLGIEAPVLEGTDDETLNRGVGHIDDTAKPGDAGNSGIAGHRDGFFRPLKDARVGDLVEIETPHDVRHYRIERTWVVDPEDVAVLDPTPLPSITLVTCYPFYFIGSAPQRFIVRAVLTSSTSTQE